MGYLIGCPGHVTRRAINSFAAETNDLLSKTFTFNTLVSDFAIFGGGKT